MATTEEGNLEGFLAYKKAKESTQNSDDDGTTTQDSDDDVAANDTIAQDDTEATDEDDSTEDVQDEDTEQTSDEDEAETETAPGEDETEGEDEEVRLDSETVNELARAYADELLTTEELQKRIEAAAEEKAAQKSAEREDAARAESAVAELIQQGETAVNGMFGLLEAAKAEFGKASQEEDFDPEVLKPEDFGKHLNDYGMAIVAEVRGRYQRALDRTVMDALKGLPTLSQEQADEIGTILQTARRMEGDEAQAPHTAYYLTNSLVSFVVKQARESAIVEERERVSSRKTVASKVAGSVAVKAAAAKLLKQKGKIAPNAPPNAKTETEGEVSEAAYERLKKAGKYAEAQAVVDQMSRRQAALSR